MSSFFKYEMSAEEIDRLVERLLAVRDVSSLADLRRLLPPLREKSDEELTRILDRMRQRKASGDRKKGRRSKFPSI